MAATCRATAVHSPASSHQAAFSPLASRPQREKDEGYPRVTDGKSHSAEYHPLNRVCTSPSLVRIGCWVGFFRARDSAPRQRGKHSAGNAPGLPCFMLLRVLGFCRSCMRDAEAAAGASPQLPFHSRSHTHAGRLSVSPWTPPNSLQQPPIPFLSPPHHLLSLTHSLASRSSTKKTFRELWPSPGSSAVSSKLIPPHPVQS